MLRYLGTGQRWYGTRPVRPSTRSHWEFEAVLSGRIGPTLDGELALTQDRTLWVFPPQHRHGWTGDGGKPAEVVVFQFPNVPEPLRSLVLSRGHRSCGLNDADIVRLRQLSDLATGCLERPGPLDPLHFQAILIELSLLTLRDLPARELPTPADPSRRRVQKATAWFRAHLHHAPSISEVAAAVFTSPSNLRRLFHEVYGRCTEEVLTDLRFERAHELLEEGGHTLEHVAGQCGFASASSFSRSFKHHFQVNPSEWLEQNARHGTGG